MQIDAEKLAALIPKEVLKEAGSTGGLEWIKQIDGIIKGVNQMLTTYQEISGKKPVNVIENMGDKPNFSEARAAKKLEIAARGNNHQEGEKMPDNQEFKELIHGLIKACKTLEALKYGEKSIGEIVMSLPFTLTQSREFLEKLYKTKYGG